MRAGSEPADSGRADFALQPAYRSALKLCGYVFDLEERFPQDEREVVYLGMKRASAEIGSLLAAGYGRVPSPEGRDLFRQARSRLMEARHFVLLAETRYLITPEDAAGFEALYTETLDGIEMLLAAGDGP
jgi:four helix bundle protein